MDNNIIFEKNLAALSRIDASLRARLSRAQPTQRYTFIETPNGQSVPALKDPNAKTGKALHSTIDPKREAQRLVEASAANGFVILLGLGGGYYAEAALEQQNAAIVLVIDYDTESVAQLLHQKDYSAIFGDPRFRFLLCPTEAEIETYILALYQPLLHGGIQTLPLRARTAGDSGFTRAAAAIENAVKQKKADYSVQAYFGTRWFSNIIRNLKTAEKTRQNPWPHIQNAAVTAAGPSLAVQLPLIRQKQQNGLYLIATDTSLPALLAENIEPNAVVTIDCQHISYYHYLAGLPKNTALFMDLAGPPPIASLAPTIRFFSGSHPLTVLVRRACIPLPLVDTSGGNVTHTAIALAETLGAKTVELYGADFSYPQGQTYVRGAYIHQLFEKDQNRLTPLEARHSAFLFRGPLEKINNSQNWYYESPSLKFYRERLEETFGAGRIKLLPATGKGAAIQVRHEAAGAQRAKQNAPPQNPPAPTKNATEFLNFYKDEIEALPIRKDRVIPYSGTLQNSAILATLLPTAAAIKRRNPALNTAELMAETKKHCLLQIERVQQAEKEPVLP